MPLRKAAVPPQTGATKYVIEWIKVGRIAENRHPIRPQTKKPTLDKSRTASSDATFRNLCVFHQAMPENVTAKAKRNTMISGRNKERMSETLKKIAKTSPDILRYGKKNRTVSTWDR